MKNIDIRALIVYTGLGIMGLFLLLLVMPGVMGGRTNSIILIRLFHYLPLIAAITLTALMFGISKQTPKPISAQVSRVLGVGAAASMLLSVASTYVSTRTSLDRGATRFVYENIGVGLLFTAYTATLILMNRQRFVYWPFWSADDKKHADEREKTVRNRVFEKAYRINILLVLVGLWLASVDLQRMHHELYQTAILCLLGLPSIIASWQKDS